jgi:hypothetical protein
MFVPLGWILKQDLQRVAQLARVGCINSLSCGGSFVFVDEAAERSRRRTAADAAGWPLVEGFVRGSGACNSSARCGLCSL